MDRGHGKIEATSDVLCIALEDVRSHLRSYSDLIAYPNYRKYNFP